LPLAFLFLFIWFLLNLFFISSLFNHFIFIFGLNKYSKIFMANRSVFKDILLRRSEIITNIFFNYLRYNKHNSTKNPNHEK